MPVEPRLVLTVGSYAASMLVNKVLDMALKEAGDRLLAFVKKVVSSDPAAIDGLRFSKPSRPPVHLLPDVERVVSGSPALRRHRLIAPAVAGASMLWVDENPENNLYERATFRSMGITIDLVTTTREALDRLSQTGYDVLISDMERHGDTRAGLRLLEEIRFSGAYPRIIFYIGTFDPERGTPVGAFGITDRPDELMHLVFDALERERV